MYRRYSIQREKLEREEKVRQAHEKYWQKVFAKSKSKHSSKK